MRRRVEMFTLTGHPKAKRCYAWNSANDDAEPRYIVLRTAACSLPAHCCSRRYCERPAEVIDRRCSRDGFSGRIDILRSAARNARRRGFINCSQYRRSWRARSLGESWRAAAFFNSQGSTCQYFGINDWQQVAIVRDLSPQESGREV